MCTPGGCWGVCVTRSCLEPSVSGRQHSREALQLRLRLRLQVRQAQKFLSKGDRVKVTLQFKGREMDHREMGQEMFKVGEAVMGAGAGWVGGCCG